MKGNPANIEKLETYLEENDFEYSKLSPSHYRILGPVAIVDVWPTRMTVHIVVTESVDPARYFRLSPNFKPEELNKLLYGESL